MKIPKGRADSPNTERTPRSEAQVKLACAIELALSDAEERGLPAGSERMAYVIHHLIGRTGMHPELQARWLRRLNLEDKNLDSAA